MYSLHQVVHLTYVFFCMYLSALFFFKVDYFRTLFVNSIIFKYFLEYVVYKQVVLFTVNIFHSFL